MEQAPIDRIDRLEGDASSSSAVGRRLGNLFQLQSAPSFTTTGLHAGKLAVTDIRSDEPVLGLTAEVPREDAYLLILLDREMHDHQVWENGRPFPRQTVKAGEFILRDLKRGQAALIDQPHHTTHFYFSRAALNDLADDAGAARIEELRYEPGAPINDPIASHLAACFRPAFVNPEEVNRLFLEHVLTAMGVHVATTYGGMTTATLPPTGGLARWQERRAMEILRENLDGSTSLTDVARQCGLSVSQFSRAFKQSTGVAPHRWLLHQRVEQAKAKLANPAASLASIAQACGFSDQSHLTRVFSRYTGVTPAAWRRSR